MTNHRPFLSPLLVLSRLRFQVIGCHGAAGGCQDIPRFTLEATNLAAIHGKRVTIQPEDLARRVVSVESARRVY
ncbi:hypothetical protein DFH08DRAFT_951866 [Mycena albidolilacea]|uniref:Uncharacterized protein n=1 Tax=Mycena albidolilacea TaxID=1033008 RepID=A0AAD7AKD3_9AGAR|nr:hypothetical protein DFH08DRAFT_951866 [Mycena albidolilacea]